MGGISRAVRELPRRARPAAPAQRHPVAQVQRQQRDVRGPGDKLQRLHRRIQPLGLAPAQLMVLLEHWDEDGLTQRDLMTRLGVEQATMANTLKRMERDGLILRRRCPQDRRAQRAAQDQNRVALSGLSPSEAEQLFHLMQRGIGRMMRR